MIKLAVIGGGPSAACVVEAVARYIAPEIEVSVDVFEPGANLWRGRVFQPDGDEVLANLPMVEMSARASDPEHGTRWLREHELGELATVTRFPSRCLVGRYLEDTAQQAIASIRAAGSDVQVHRRAVRSLVTREGRLQACGDGWQAGPFDQAVLCIGGAPSYDHYKLGGAAGFISNPYPLHQSMAQVPVHARVGIVGSGLTAVDVVVALRARGHQGPITLISRHGYLPAVRRAPVRHVLHHLTASRLQELACANGHLGLEDVLGLVAAELSEAGADPTRIAADVIADHDPKQRLREDFQRAIEDNDPGWTVLRDALVACGQDAWYLLDEQDKARIRTMHQTLMRHCCPMPPGNAKLLLDMFATGQLDVLSGIRSIQPLPDRGFRISARREVDVDVVVGASTPAHHLPAPEAAPLVTSLISQGLAVPHPFGGIRVDQTRNRLITGRGVPDGRLHALGDITHGAYLFTFGMPGLATGAERIVRDIRKGISYDYAHAGIGLEPAEVRAS